jgi:5-aminolevulinate synthase
VAHLKSSGAERAKLAERAGRLKRRFAEANLPAMPSVTHIVPLMVGDARACKRASDELLTRHGVYVQPINYPTVPRGTERLRFTATPFHDDSLMDKMVASVDEVWTRLGLARAPRAQAAE